MSKGVIMIPPTAGRGGPTPRYRASGLRTCVKTSRLEEGVAVEPFVAPATRTRAISPPLVVPSLRDLLGTKAPEAPTSRYMDSPL